MTTADRAPSTLSTAGLLGAWERACGQPEWARSLTLLAATGEEPFERLAELPIGARDARLLALRAAVFGSAIAATAACPGCGEVAELEVDGSLFAGSAPSGSTGQVVVDGRTIEFRLPTTSDLASVAGAAPADAAQAAALLLDRCLDASALGTLDEREIDIVVGAMEAADPVAAVTLGVTCPRCGNQWPAALDIAAFVWDEVAVWGERLLAEVDVLARVYGWPEPEVLALSKWRRRRYVELALS